MLLEDAFNGRAHQGMFFLLPASGHSKLFFKIQTSTTWKWVVIAAAMLHACLVFWEPLTFREAWGVGIIQLDTCPGRGQGTAQGDQCGSGLDGQGEAAVVWLAELVCLLIYLVDVAMKHLWATALAPPSHSEGADDLKLEDRSAFAAVVNVARYTSAGRSASSEDDMSQDSDGVMAKASQQMERTLSKKRRESLLSQERPSQWKTQEDAKLAELRERMPSKEDLHCIRRDSITDRCNWLVALMFLLDFVGYYSRLVPLRFARPFRMAFMASKLNNVCFLIAFLPKMCYGILRKFSAPLTG